MIKVDAHAHVVPPFFREALEQQGGDPAGWHIPQWSPEAAIAVQDSLTITTSVLSVTSPGCLFLDIEKNRKLARRCNEYCSEVRRDHPSRFGFYVNIPNPVDDLPGCLAEVEYGLDVLKGDGVCLFTQYNGLYLGNPKLGPLWHELNRRGVTVIIHPTPPHGYKAIPDQPFCPCPIFDYPHETTRTVSDLIMSGRKAECPAVKIVLCHGGGTIPYLAERIRYLSSAPALRNPLTAEAIAHLFTTFYYDTAICGLGPAFDLTAAFVPTDRLVIGTDHPYAAPEAMMRCGEAVDQRPWSNEARQKLYEVNARALFPRLFAESIDASK